MNTTASEIVIDVKFAQKENELSSIDSTNSGVLNSTIPE